VEKVDSSAAVASVKSCYLNQAKKKGAYVCVLMISNTEEGEQLRNGHMFIVVCLYNIQMLISFPLLILFFFFRDLFWIFHL